MSQSVDQNANPPNPEPSTAQVAETIPDATFRSASGGHTATRRAPDPRRHAFRADLADRALEGLVEAARFVEGRPMQVRAGLLPVRRKPQADAPLDSEALHGETVVVFDESDGWVWGQLAADGYVGYLPAAGLTPVQANAATHRVKALGTFVYPKADFKAPPAAMLPLNAEVQVIHTGEKFSELATSGFVATRHLQETTRFERDFVDVAERFLGVPYLWGGRTRIGLDCSGLVQTAMRAAGLEAPRDSDMQQAEIGASALIPEDLEGLQRGDLVFWRGHVGIMTDGMMLLHANAHHMAVAIEPLATAAARIARDAQPIAEIRRPVRLSASATV